MPERRARSDAPYHLQTVQGGNARELSVKSVPEGRGKAVRTYKTPEQLEGYSKKRSFDKTPEPPPAERIEEARLEARPTSIIGEGSAFE